MALIHLQQETLCKRSYKLLEQHNIYEWRPYPINIHFAEQLKPKDLEKNCLFPALFKIEMDTGAINYIKADTVKQCLSLITIYQDIKYHFAIYPYIYMNVKRKALLVGKEAIALIEYIQETDNKEALFNSRDTISLDLNEISEQERSAFKIISDLLLFQGGWTLEYAIDFQSSVYILSYDNGYELDDFSKSTSDLLIPQSINLLFRAYDAQRLTSSLYHNILTLGNVAQKFYLLCAYKKGMLIEPVRDSLENAEITFNGITHRISEGFFNPQNNQIRANNKLSLYEDLANQLNEYLIPTVVLTR